MIELYSVTLCLNLLSLYKYRISILILILSIIFLFTLLRIRHHKHYLIYLTINLIKTNIIKIYKFFTYSLMRRIVTNSPVTVCHHYSALIGSALLDCLYYLFIKKNIVMALLNNIAKIVFKVQKIFKCEAHK